MTQDKDKSRRLAAGLQATQALLISIIKRPSQFLEDANLRNDLKSQANLAKLDRIVISEDGQDLQTYPMSLNSFKTHCNETLAGGFNTLNDLRQKALIAIGHAEKSETRANKRSKSGLTLKVSQLENELEMQRQTNMILLRGLGEAMTQFASIRDASDTSTREKRTQDALATLRAIVSMNRYPFNHVQLAKSSTASSEVVNINEYRDK